MSGDVAINSWEINIQRVHYMRDKSMYKKKE